MSIASEIYTWLPKLQVTHWHKWKMLQTVTDPSICIKRCHWTSSKFPVMFRNFLKMHIYQFFCTRWTAQIFLKSGNFLNTGATLVSLTCRKKSCTIQCSDTCDPIANLLFSCFSMRFNSSWSSCVVKPSTPASYKKWNINKLSVKKLKRTYQLTKTWQCWFDFSSPIFKNVMFKKFDKTNSFKQTRSWWLKEAIWIRSRDNTTMNKDEGAYKLDQLINPQRHHHQSPSLLRITRNTTHKESEQGSWLELKYFVVSTKIFICICFENFTNSI